jgi:PIN domain nuclease of toxin-antitoxin system
MSGSDELSSQSIEKIDRAALHGSLFVSAISVWEVATLARKGRISLHMSTAEWVRQSLGKPGINLAALSAEIAVESASLPDGFHGNPADRIIVATARIHRITLLTRDEKILSFGKQQHVLAEKA